MSGNVNLFLLATVIAKAVNGTPAAGIAIVNIPRTDVVVNALTIADVVLMAVVTLRSPWSSSLTSYAPACLVSVDGSRLLWNQVMLLNYLSPLNLPFWGDSSFELNVLRWTYPSADA